MRSLHTMIQRALLLISLVLCPLTLALAEDWPQWRGPDRTGVSKETGLLQSWPTGGPKLLWTFRDAGTGYSNMSVVGDRLYSMGAHGDKEYVYAIDLKTRKKLWSTEIGDLHVDGYGPGPRSSPVVDGNFLYAIGGRGDLVCVETTSGRKVWSQRMKPSLGKKEPNGYGHTESPLVDGDLVIATPGGKKGAIAAFDKKTGKLKWRSTECTDDFSGYSSIIAIEVGGIRQYIQAPGASVIGVRASDGKLLWKFPFPWVVSTPIYRDDCVFVSSLEDCNLLKLVPDGDKCKTELIYAKKEMKTHVGGAVLVGEYLYGYSKTKGIMCQDFKTGKTVWASKRDRGSGSVIFADGNLYCFNETFYTSKGYVLLVKATPSGYQEQGKFHIPERTLPVRYEQYTTYTHPVVANGKLYLRDQGLIFCYDVHKP
jgi:outer membrane protein assembly factor BamB